MKEVLEGNVYNLVIRKIFKATDMNKKGNVQVSGVVSRNHQGIRPSLNQQ